MTGTKKTDRGKAYSLRFPNAAIQKTIEETAKALGTDETNFLRLVISESLPKYVQRAAAILRGQEPPETSLPDRDTGTGA